MKHFTIFTALLFAVSCGAPANVRRTLPLTMNGTAPTAANDSGWTVSLTSATATVSTVRFFTGKSLLTRRFDWSSLLIGTAHAHPGHYLPGEALGELIATTEVDLLSTTPVALGEASAVTGEYGSMQLTFVGSGMRLKGTATRGSSTVRFDTTAYLPPIALEGISFDQKIGTEAGTVNISVLLQSIVSRIDFSATGAAGADGVTTFTSADPAFNGFVRGLQDTSSYSVKWITAQ